MPQLSSLGLGIRTLTEASQLTSVAPAQAILATSRNILQMVDADKGESQDSQRLALLVLDTAIVYSDLMKRLGKSERDSNDIKRISSTLFSRLEIASDAILDNSKRGWLARALGRSATKKTLQGCEAELEHISSILETQIQLRNVKNSEVIAAQSESRDAERVLEERMSEAQQETLDLIKSKVAEQRRQKLERSSFAHFPPAASPIFFGRSDHVNHLVKSLVKAPAYHAILGPGGIGKTSLALNVLHDPRIITAYGSHRYFLACETTADASGIIAGISDIFNMEESSFLKSFRRYCDSIESNILFLLDNFETPWERPEARRKVEELLTQLSDIPNLSMIVTLRGAERPYGVQWTRPFLPPIGPLDFAAARQTFASIADVREDDADMVTLLNEVDGIPLAITLLGALAQYVSCASLLAQWSGFRTSMVTRGWESRLSSLDVSISLSLTTARFTSDPRAIHLLQILSLLPDGATVEEIVSMTPTGFDVHTAVSTLYQVALAYTNTHDRISVLGPIREYVLSKHPMSQSLLGSILSYHAGLSNYAFSSHMTAEAPIMESRLITCIGNIQSVLRACLKIDTLCDESIKAAIMVSAFRRSKELGSIAPLLEESIKHASLLQVPSLHAACLTEVGYRKSFNGESQATARACLEESVNVLRKLPDSSDLLAVTLSVLTQVLYQQGCLEEGIKRAQESVGLIKETTSPVTSALAYMHLGVVQIENGNPQEGIKAMDFAASCFEPSTYPILALMYSRYLTWGYLKGSRLNKAIEAADISLNLDLNMSNTGTRRHHLAAHPIGYRGIAFMFSGRFEDAIEDFQETIDTLSYYGMEKEIGVFLLDLGTARLGCSDLRAASIAFQVALRIRYSPVHLPLNQHLAALELCRDNLDQAFLYCAMAKGDVYREGSKSSANLLLLQVQSQVHIRRGDATDSISIPVLSVVVSYKTQDRAELARLFLVLGDAYFFIEKDILSAKACYQASLDLMRYLGYWRCIANTLMRLGVVNHLQGEPSLAVRRLNQAIGFYEMTAGAAWAEYCKERLRVIEHGILEGQVPFFPPMFQFF